MKTTKLQITIYWFTCLLTLNSMLQCKNTKQQQKASTTQSAIQYTFIDSAKMVGKLLKKPWSKSLDSYCAQGSDYYVLSINENEEYVIDTTNSPISLLSFINQIVKINGLLLEKNITTILPSNIPVQRPISPSISGNEQDNDAPFTCTVLQINKIDLLDTSPLQEVNVHYNTWKGSITITNTNITQVHITYDYEQPNSAIPSDGTSFETSGKITPKQLKELVNYINDIDFWTLKDVYGAPAGYRFYLYEIAVNIDGKTKKVMYRSNPTYEVAPAAFGQLEQYLTQLARSIEKRQD